MNHFKPPGYQPTTGNPVSVFLAGSIEMGSAPDWQAQIARRLQKANLAVDVFNPRRDDWNPRWEQSINNKQFAQQVHWELDHIASCDIVFFYFAPGTASPVSMLELGLSLASYAQTIVCCPEGFGRKGNIDIVCERFENEVFTSLDDAYTVLETTVRNTISPEYY